MTKDQFWRCFTGIFGCVKNVTFSITSAYGASSHDISALGQQLFTMLCGNHGNLLFGVSQTACASQGEQDLQGLSVDHSILHVYYDGSLYGSEGCFIDGRRCNVDPPHLMSDKMPREVAVVGALMQSSMISFTPHMAVRYSVPIDNKAVQEFACNGNLDVAAWKDNLQNTDDIGLNGSRLLVKCHFLP